MNPRHKFLRLRTLPALLFGVLVLPLGHLLEAQQAGCDQSTSQQLCSLVGGDPYIEAWVDPCFGDDSQGQVGRQDRPFRTILQAQIELRDTSAPWVLSPDTPALIHCNPGVYGSSAVGGNGEPLPVRMLDNIHILGLGAQRCILRGDQQQSRFPSPWYPLETPEGGTRDPREVLLDLSFLQDPDYDELFDAFTFQGGHVQVYAETEGKHLAARVSNCVFDMLDQSDVGLDGPDFGVLMVHTYDFDFDPDQGGAPLPPPPVFASQTQTEGGYFDIFLHLFNNTFIQGWDDATLGVIEADFDSVAVCDVANTLIDDPLFMPPVATDPSPQYRGVGNPNLQNNLIRYVTDHSITAFLGIDDTDTTAAVGTVVGPTNAFDPDVALEANGRFTSLIMQPGVAPAPGSFTGNGAVPNPKVVPTSGTSNPTAVPEGNVAFVGEYLSHGLGRPPEYSRDWRVLPDSLVIDQGTSPLLIGQGTSNTRDLLEAGNGTGYDRIGRNTAEWSFLHDGEHFGNLRRQGMSVDIGFDESDALILAGGYTNDSTAQAGLDLNAPCGIQQPFFCVPAPAGTVAPLVDHVEIYPEAGQATMFTTTADPCILQSGPFFEPGGYHFAASFWWGLAPFPSLFTGLPGVPIHPAYPFAAAWLLDLTPIGIATLSPRTVSSATWVTPDDGVTHSFGLFLDPIVNLNHYQNQQASFVPASNPGVIALSNAQSFYE